MMKGKFWKKTLAAVLALTVVSGAVPVKPVADLFGGLTITASARGGVAEGCCGEPEVNEGKNVTWTLTKNDDNTTYTLTISGTGAMNDYNNISSRPWNAYRDRISTVIIENGVTSIGYYAFYSCQNLNSVTIQSGVTSIGVGAFFLCSSLVSIKIPESVTNIRESAFSDTAWLTARQKENPLVIINNMLIDGTACTGTVEIPDGVTSIEKRAFRSCPGITSVIIPDSVTGIGMSAFSGCTNLTSVTDPDSVTSIGESAFSNTPWLKAKQEENPLVILNNILIDGSTCTGEVEIPDGVTSIGDGAFFHSELTSVTIPDGVTSIGEEAFSRCYSLTAAVVPDSVTSIGDYAFDNCNSLTSFIIPQGVTSIGSSAFSYCTKLTSIIIPDSVERIGSHAFENCSSLDSVILEGETPPELGKSVFQHTSYQLTIYVPDAQKNTYQTAWSDYGSIIASSQIKHGSCGENVKWSLSKGGTLTISGSGDMENFDELTSVPWNAYNAHISSIVIENGVTSIGNNAFGMCKALTSVTIPNSVTSIGNYAFCCCTNLTSLTIPSGVTSIGNEAFSNCTNLTSVTIPNSVTGIGAYAFSDCTSLTFVTISDSVTSIGEQAFSGCTSLTSITIPKSVTSIGVRAFSGCTNLQSVIVEWDTPPSIDGKAFYDTSSDLKIYVPAGKKNDYQEKWTTYTDRIVPATAGGDCGAQGANVKWSFYEKGKNSYLLVFSGTGAMADYTGSNVVPWANLIDTKNRIKEAVIGNGVTSIGNYVFTYCGLTSITIPNSVTSIGKEAFSYCTSLSSVTIPDSVTSIGEEAFRICQNLTSVIIPNSVTSIGKHAFFSCKSLTAVAIPNSVTSIGEGVFEDCTSLTSVTIPNTVTSIRDYVFKGCKNLTSVTIPDTVTSIGELAFDRCLNLTSIIIPDRVESIGRYAFYQCTGLTAVTIPNSVKSIGYGAFMNCSKLAAVSVEADTPPTLAADAFQSVSSDLRILVPAVNLKTYREAEKWRTYAAKIRSVLSPTVTVNGWTEGAYDETANAPQVNGNPSTGKASFYYKKATDDDAGYSENVPNAPGTYILKAVIPETDDYTASEAITGFRIWGVPAVTAPKALNPTRQNSSVKLIQPGSAEHGTMFYSIGTQNAPGDTWVTNANAITANKGGTYYVWYKVISDKDYADVEAQSITVKVSQYSAPSYYSQSWKLTTENYVFDGTAHEPTVTGTMYGEITYTYYNDDTNEVLDAAPIDPGNYRVRVFAEGGTRYYSRTQEATYSILSPFDKNGMADVSAFKKNNIIPTTKGKVFAGWFTDSTCTTPYKKDSGKAFAKFIDNKILTVKAQISNGTMKKDGSTSIRFITSLDSLKYQNVGFKITFNGKTIEQKLTKVYSALLANGKKVNPGVFCEASHYMSAFTLNNIPQNAFDKEFTVTPYYTTEDGTVVEGETSTYVIADMIK